MSDYLHMGGYAAFVWPSFLVMVVILIGNVVTARSALRRALVEAKRRIDRDQSAEASASRNGDAWQQEGAGQ